MPIEYRESLRSHYLHWIWESSLMAAFPTIMSGLETIVTQELFKAAGAPLMNTLRECAWTNLGA